MGNIKIQKGVFDTKLELMHAGVRAGFPSPAEDYVHETLDFNRDYIRHPEASFYGDVEGDSMKDAGIFDGDRVIIDSAVEPHQGSIIVAFWNGEFTIKYLDLTHKKDGYIELRPANPDYPVFKVEAGDDFQVWGVVIHLIRTITATFPANECSGLTCWASLSWCCRTMTGVWWRVRTRQSAWASRRVRRISNWNSCSLVRRLPYSRRTTSCTAS